MIFIITASPNADGLTAACADAAKRGVEGAGGSVEVVSLNALGIRGCEACGNGWGTCRPEHSCVIEDEFMPLKAKLLAAEGAILVTPVYWGQPAERMKYFLDRARRCEASHKESTLKGKPIALVAAAGGSGNGTVTCLADMELWCRHVGSVPFERIGVSRFNREQVLAVIEKAAERLEKGQ